MGPSFTHSHSLTCFLHCPLGSCVQSDFYGAILYAFSFVDMLSPLRSGQRRSERYLQGLTLHHSMTFPRPLPSGQRRLVRYLRGRTHSHSVTLSLTCALGSGKLKKAGAGR